jgi:hypothetical protein
VPYFDYLFIQTISIHVNGTNLQINLTLTGSKQMPLSSHIFKLDSIKPQLSNSAGSRTFANADNFPILSGWSMAAYLLRLKRVAIREPHWHPNAS